MKITNASIWRCTCTTIVLSIISSLSFGIHNLGGDLSYECVGKGKFIFELTLYKDCSSIPIPLTGYTVEAFGLRGKLSGKGVSGNIITLNYSGPIGGMDISDECAPLGTTGPADLYCSAGPNGNGSAAMKGAISKFVFRSDSVDFSKIEPPAKNQFYVFYAISGIQCCRNQPLNVSNCSNLVIRTTMHRYEEDGKAIKPADLCDSSPKTNTPLRAY